MKSGRVGSRVGRLWVGSDPGPKKWPVSISALDDLERSLRIVRLLELAAKIQKAIDLYYQRQKNI